ncbi:MULTISPECIES: hypothetical protein [unclassified Mesorhizobium]|uniref:hypothetical protein n=1 Tax=unclassified Mesorhizobium TaxID=325217 RepID=UPI000FE34B31|nr:MULTISPECIES: hypothetical protein [unclassified Mesorhizobium]TGP18094.1 hypothetical protein EN874_031040 [Mesorhizobium sp. M1D.F.Ca.ET.231.01.1.1]TGS37862.1 hypothetical protein EN827_30600 [Mesorhizobium sp. M1D.F.Ca.ET.184.01.1.1]TGS58215.1 hypothetical protein EN826_030575 [Mesorhizobium sp. M1D.F.Ca.ET.183.01.1.1]
MLISYWGNIPSVSKLENGETVPSVLDMGLIGQAGAGAVLETNQCCRLDKQRPSKSAFGVVVTFGTIQSRARYEGCRAAPLAASGT